VISKTPDVSQKPQLNRKERKEHKEDPFVRDTQKVLCDVFAFLAVFAVPSGMRDFDRSPFSGWSFRWVSDRQNSSD